VSWLGTRKGTVVFLDQIIREAASVMHEQTSLEVGLVAIKIQDMAAKRIHNYDFNWDRMISFEGGAACDTGDRVPAGHTRM